MSLKTRNGQHEVLDQHGLKLRERGNGLTLSSGTLHVKPSSVDRGLSKGRLEKRLGPFQGHPEASRSVKTPVPKQSYTRQPLRHAGFDFSGLWEQYQSEQGKQAQNREQELIKARTQRDTALQQLWKIAGIKNTLIRYATSGVLKRVLYWQSSSNLRKKQEEMRKSYQEERKRIYAAHSRVTWNAWLSQQAENGNAEALAALQSRRSEQAEKGNHITGVRRREEQPLRPENVTRKGTLLLPGGFRDTGTALLFPKTDADAIRKGLELAAKTFGNPLSVNGSDVFRVKVVQVATGLPVTFSDPILEQARRELVLSQRTSSWQRETARGR